MLTGLEQWEEWMARCAIGRCGATTAAALRRFGAHRFRQYLVAGLGNRFTEGAVPDGRDCFHLLETHCRIGTARTGKRYKAWIAGRGRGAPDAALFESGASLLLRNTVRAYLRREGPVPWQVSADAVIEGTDGLTLADLLPDTRETASIDPDTAEAVARACLARLSENHRIVVLARRVGMPLSHPSVLALTGVAKSRTAQFRVEVFERLAAETRLQEPDGDRKLWLQIALQASEWMENFIFLQERVEKRWRRCFMGVEDLYE
ncbi:MAG: hypothetical protein FJ222_11310 [Lentisphaerae bacterium]|nr:hypothetical protein [Lentisphaerota bacterium]